MKPGWTEETPEGLAYQASGLIGTAILALDPRADPSARDVGDVRHTLRLAQDLIGLVIDKCELRESAIRKGADLTPD